MAEGMYTPLGFDVLWVAKKLFFNCSIIFFLGKGVGKNDLLAFALLHYLKQLFLLFEQANFCDQKQSQEKITSSHFGNRK